MVLHPHPPNAMCILSEHLLSLTLPFRLPCHKLIQLQRTTDCWGVQLFTPWASNSNYETSGDKSLWHKVGRSHTKTPSTCDVRSSRARHNTQLLDPHSQGPVVPNQHHVHNTFTGSNYTLYIYKHPDSLHCMRFLGWKNVFLETTLTHVDSLN